MNQNINDFSLTVTNERVHDFYRKNPNIDFEAMNLLLIDFLQNLNNDLSSTIQNTVSNEILSYVKTVNTDMMALKSELKSSSNSNVVKIYEINKEFLENIRNMVGNTVSTNTDKVNTMLDKNTDLLISKMKEIIPINNDEITTKVASQLKEMQETIHIDLKNKSPEKLEEYFVSIDHKLQSIQQPIFSFMSANTEQLSNQMTNLRESTAITHASQEKVYNSIEDFLNKYRTSSSLKGQYSENMVEGILNKLYPSAEVLNTTSNKATGDFLLKRNGFSTILIENKNYESNVNTEEIKKFIRDIREQNCSGVFISQFSGIVNKPNYLIEIHDGNVLVYIHNVEYSSEKIKTAIDIVDNLSLKLKDFENSNTEGIRIPKDVLDNINSEFQVFVTQKEALVSIVKDMQKKMVNQIEELKLPDLQLYLNGKYASIENQSFVCEVCGECFVKRTGLASHRKAHKVKNEAPK
jgi:hypothetical protein|tara:strand:+ start:757 stop:2151 length:1395 start_codon:yes stop_codon:yes gene_type:complete